MPSCCDHPARRRPITAWVVAAVALFFAFGGTAYAAGVAKNSVGEAQLKSSAVSSAKIKAKAVSGDKVADRTITGGKIANKAITRGQVADNTIGTGQIADNSISSGDVADNSLSGGDIADGSIRWGELDDNVRQRISQGGAGVFVAPQIEGIPSQMLTEYPRTLEGYRVYDAMAGNLLVEADIAVESHWSKEGRVTCELRREKDVLTSTTVVVPSMKRGSAHVSWYGNVKGGEEITMQCGSDANGSITGYGADGHGASSLRFTRLG